MVKEMRTVVFLKEADINWPWTWKIGAHWYIQYFDWGVDYPICQKSWGSPLLNMVDLIISPKILLYQNLNIILKKS